MTIALPPPPTHSPRDLAPAERIYWLTAPSAIDTPRFARNHVAEALTNAGFGCLTDTARLLVSEATTNVLQHTKVPRLTVRTSIWPDRVRVAVQDGAPGRVPLRRALGPFGEHGRGLALIAALSDDWGVTWFGVPDPESKEAWFELREPGAAMEYQ